MIEKNIGKILELDRSRVDNDVNTDAYLLQYGADWSVFAKVEPEFFISGYSLIRNDTIDQYCVVDIDDDFLHKSLVKLGEVPLELPALDLADLVSTIKTLNKQFSLLTFHRELIDNEICSVGAVSKVTDKAVSFLEISSIATVGRDNRMSLSEITKIDFGGKYEMALWKLAGKKAQTQLAAATNKL